jgi:hypothetical protein
MECAFMIGRPLTNSEFWQLLVAKNTGRTDPLRYRNKLLLLLAGLAGLRESELTLITIGLFVSPTGDLREFAVLPDSITRDGYERPVVMSHPSLKEAFEQYIQWLLQSGINTQPAAHHLGLDPTAPLLVNDKGVSFSMQSRGEGVLSPSAINKCLDTLIMNAGLADVGIKRISLLRTAVIESYRSGMSTSDLMITTGFSAETISTILAMDIEQYSPIADWFTNRQEAKVKRLESFKKRRVYMI